MIRHAALGLLAVLHIGCAVGVAANSSESLEDAADNVEAMCAAPDTNAACDACSGNTCQSNGCYNGYFCNVQTLHCSKSCP